VHKLLQIVNSPLFAGSGHQDGWTLRESLVRLGRQRVGAIAQQVKLMNNLIKPESSQFNLERFWTHSLTSAFIADYLIQKKRLSLTEPIPLQRLLDWRPLTRYWQVDIGLFLLVTL
jgi:HD-like signal output (HDOD) protein